MGTLLTKHELFGLHNLVRFLKKIKNRKARGHDLASTALNLNILRCMGILTIYKNFE